MSKGRKVKVDIDYKVYGNTGEKIPIIRETATNMDLESRKILELKVVADLKDILENDEIEEMDSDELEEKLGEMSELSKTYRHLHVEIKSIHENYDDAYPDCKEFSDKIRNFIRDIKKKLKEKSATKSSDKSAELKSSFQIEESIVSERVDRELKNFDVQSIDDTADLRDGCARFDSLLDDYYGLLSRTKIALKNDFDTDFKDIFDETLSKITERLLKMKSKIKHLNEEKEQSDQKERLRREKEAHDSFIGEQKFQIKIMSEEIESRCNELVSKCDVTCLPKMSDQEIFGRGKSVDAIDCEMRKIFHKLTDLSKLASVCGSEKEKLLEKPQKQKDETLKARNDYMKLLFSIVRDREITEEKLRSTKGLDINLPTFSGYDSKLDIYSFRTEFEKLVQPTTLKRLWVDVLKKKYLSGHALTLVDIIDDISDVWKKLIGAYGNIKLLLQNRMGSLDKLQSLEKISGDEKLGNAISKIINTMTELSNLAEKNNLECKLYIGGGLDKVINIIGETRERKFLQQNIDTEETNQTTSNSEVFAEKTTWEHLKKFLQKELALCEKLTLMQKSRDCLGVKGSKGNPTTEKGSSGAHPVLPKMIPCHLCGKTDHVLSTDKKGGKHVDYFSCKKFVEASCKDRLDQIKRKGFCLQCLTPGIKSSEKHFCHTKYACTDPIHSNFEKSLHICPQLKN